MSHRGLIHNDGSSILDDLGQCCSTLDDACWLLFEVRVEWDLEDAVQRSSSLEQSCGSSTGRSRSRNLAS